MAPDTCAAADVQTEEVERGGVERGGAEREGERAEEDPGALPGDAGAVDVEAAAVLEPVEGLGAGVAVGGALQDELGRRARGGDVEPDLLLRLLHQPRRVPNSNAQRLKCTKT